MYNPNASPLIEAANRLAYELETEYNSRIALTGGAPLSLKADWLAAEAELQAHILTRTTAQGAVAS